MTGAPTTDGQATPGPSTARLLPWVGVGGAFGAATSLTLAAGLRRTADAGPLGASTLGALLGDAAASDPAAAALAPLAVAAVLNVAGAFALGLLRGRAARATARGRSWDPRVVPGLGTGFLGSFTSFSALAAPLGALLGRSAATGAVEAGTALAPIGGAVVLMVVVGTLAAAGGLRLGRGARS